MNHVTNLVPDTTFELVETSDHGPNYEEPERFNRVLGRFVDSLRAVTTDTLYTVYRL